MFKLPTWAELRALFFSPTKVAHAIAGIETAAKNAERVVVHSAKKMADAVRLSANHRAIADAFDNDADDHAAESDRANRVSVKLRELVA